MLFALALSTALAAALVFRPIAGMGVLVAVAAIALLWRRPEWTPPLLIALAANTKINFYTGSFTVFPDYPLIVIAVAVWTLRWLEGRRALEERGLAARFGVLFVTGLASIASAVEPGRVLQIARVIPIAALVTYFVATEIRTRRDLERAVAWIQGAALVLALYGIVQIAGVFFGFDPSLRFLSRWGNPDFEYSVGAPVVRAFSSTLRANSLFNDPNILAGYLSAAIALVFARLLDRRERGLPARGTMALLGVLGLCLVFTISRSGMIGASIGAAVVLALMPKDSWRMARWAPILVGSAAVLVIATLAGVGPGLLIDRIATTFDPSDGSTSVHLAAGVYGFSLFLRYPITGVGLGNYAWHYGAEVYPGFSKMMSHNVIIQWFAETGLVGGLALLALITWVARRPWRALRDRSLAARDPGLHALCVGLLGALVALLVTNLTYDFFMRTFVWCFAGAAIAAARLAERKGEAAAS